MTLPPVELGGLHRRVTLFLPDVAFGLVGAVGTFRGVKVTGLEADPAPRLLTAVMVNEYAVPLVRPLSVAEFVESS